MPIPVELQIGHMLGGKRERDREREFGLHFLTAVFVPKIRVFVKPV